MKLLCTNDWHLSLRNPVARIDDYTEELFILLDQIKRLAIKIKATAILNAGDIFHEKTGVHHELVNRLCEYCASLKKENIDIYAIPGNHDIRFDRYDSLPEQPIQTMFLSEYIRNVSFQPCYLRREVRDEPSVSLVGIPYPAAKLLDSFTTVQVASAQYKILMAHCFATPAGGNYFGERVHAYTELSATPFDVFIFGHDHSDHGVHQINGKYFVNIGALSRGSIAKENINRDVKIALIDIEHTGIKVQQVKLNYRPASEIFDLSLKAQKDKEADHISEFTEKLQEDLESVGVSYKDKLSKIEMSDEVRKRVTGYLEKAEAQTC